MQIHIAQEDDMLAFGARLGVCVTQVCDAAHTAIIFLYGELGAGKTTLARGFLRGLGYHGKVKSPTYTLVEPYQIGPHQAYHFDLYRLTDPQELEYIGLRDFLENVAIFLVEWPERGVGHLPPPDLDIHIGHADTARQISLTPHSATGAEILARLHKPDLELRGFSDAM